MENTVAPESKQAAGERAEQRVALFVDTQNLYYSARDFHSGSVDYGVLLNVALRGRHLSQATAYVVERDGDTTAFGFFGKLTTLGYRVKRKRVRVHRGDDDGTVRLEGDWDMGIAADIIRCLDYVDVVVLASGDGDFAPILELAQERGKRVEVAAFKESVGQSLYDMADRFVSLGDSQGIFLSPR